MDIRVVSDFARRLIAYQTKNRFVQSSSAMIIILANLPQNSNSSDISSSSSTNQETMKKSAPKGGISRSNAKRRRTRILGGLAPAAISSESGT
jgi:hypothetical protein